MSDDLISQGLVAGPAGPDVAPMPAACDGDRALIDAVEARAEKTLEYLVMNGHTVDHDDDLCLVMNEMFALLSEVERAGLMTRTTAAANRGGDAASRPDRPAPNLMKPESEPASPEEAARGAGEPRMHEVTFCSRVSDIVRLCGGDPTKAPPASVAVIEALLKEFYPRAPDPRPAGCVCPVERVVKVLAGCAKHGGGHE